MDECGMGLELHGLERKSFAAGAGKTILIVEEDVDFAELLAFGP